MQLGLIAGGSHQRKSQAELDAASKRVKKLLDIQKDFVLAEFMPSFEGGIVEEGALTEGALAEATAYDAEAQSNVVARMRNRLKDGVTELKDFTGSKKEQLEEIARGFAEEVGIDEAMVEEGKKIYKQGKEVKDVWDKANRFGKRVREFVDIGRENAKVLNPKRTKIRPETTTTNPLQDSGPSRPQNLVLLNDAEGSHQYSNENTLSYSKKRKHHKIRGNSHHPFSEAFQTNIHSEKRMRQHHRTPEGHLKSHYGMNIGGRIANADILNSGLGSIHWGSTVNHAFSHARNFTQSNLLSNF
jgi:hypothetical protein